MIPRTSANTSNANIQCIPMLGEVIMRTTPVFLSERIYDLITPSLPLTEGTVGWNGDGRPTETACRSTTFALASFWLFEDPSKAESAPAWLPPLLSTPFVWLFAAQFFAQLHATHVNRPTVY